MCRTVYLAFTAGYAPGTGPDLLRTDLAGEAVELAALLHRLVPEAPQVRALLGLLLLQHGRRWARVSDGSLVTLTDQDRSLWRHDELRMGITLVTALPPTGGYAEELRLQGLIAVEHAQVLTAGDTDWVTIATRYAELEALTQSPVVRLNRAIAVAETDGAEAGLALLSDLDAASPRTHRLAAVRADLARRAGHLELARASYVTALASCANEVERRHLAAQLASLQATLDS